MAELTGDELVLALETQKMQDLLVQNKIPHTFPNFGEAKLTDTQILLVMFQHYKSIAEANNLL
jgi:hypothetical protein